MSLENHLPEPEYTAAVTKSNLFDFEFEYDLSHRSIREILSSIFRDLSSQKQLHGWDNKLYTTPLKALRTATRELLGRDNGTYSCDIVMTEVVVEEVVTILETNQKRPHIQENAEDIGGHLFFSKAPLQSLAAKFPAPQVDNLIDPVPGIAQSPVLKRYHAQGRVIYTNDQSALSHRAALLVLHSFCLRLLDEFDTFIRQFIGRHLNLRPAFKIPDHFQVTSPLVEINSLQTFYKRVTLSCHIPYLMLSNNTSKLSQDNNFDRLSICIFSPDEHPSIDSKIYLTKSSSSVLLTIVLPERSSRNEEETTLLQNPQGLWTVLVINSLSQSTLPSDFSQHLTPITQYLRGITTSLSVQQSHAETIHEALKHQISITRSDGLFDDENFTKSKLYHWAIKICHELYKSITSNIRFIHKLKESQTNKLCQEAHAHEALGIKYWTQKLDEQVFELGELAEQLETLREKICENRDALHSVTAVLEARISLQQGQRIKTLTYLATAFLPLTTVASIYSMNVLPSAATLPSFFIVFAIFLLITFLIGINFPKKQPSLTLKTRNLATYIPKLKNISNISNLKTKIPKAIVKIIQACGFTSTPYEINLVLGNFSIILFLITEISLPLEIIYAYQCRNHRFLQYEWTLNLLMVHIFRLAFLPLWCILFVLWICVFPFYKLGLFLLE